MILQESFMGLSQVVGDSRFVDYDKLRIRGLYILS